MTDFGDGARSWGGVVPRTRPPRRPSTGTTWTPRSRRRCPWSPVWRGLGNRELRWQLRPGQPIAGDPSAQTVQLGESRARYLVSGACPDPRPVSATARIGRGRCSPLRSSSRAELPTCSGPSFRVRRRSPDGRMQVIDTHAGIPGYGDCQNASDNGSAALVSSDDPCEGSLASAGLKASTSRRMGESAIFASITSTKPARRFPRRSSSDSTSIGMSCSRVIIGSLVDHAAGVTA